MPDVSRRTTTSTSTSTAPQTSGTTATTESSDNSFVADLLAGRTRLDGDASSFFSRGVEFRRGMRGDLVVELQRAIGAGTDGAFGPRTEAKLRAFQRKHRLPETGSVDVLTWAQVQSTNAGGFKRPQGEEDFAKMWAAHPHNYMDDTSQNTSSDELRTQLGLREQDAENTCALRMSTMFNRMGGDYAIDTQKATDAGLDKMRASGLYLARIADPETSNQKDRAILSAKEMWTYLEHHMGPPDVEFPPRGRYKTQEEAEDGAKQVEEACDGKKGMIAFDKIFGYGGSGHVDIFDGKQLSDGSFYASEKTRIWHVVK